MEKQHAYEWLTAAGLYGRSDRRRMEVAEKVADLGLTADQLGALKAASERQTTRGKPEALLASWLQREEQELRTLVEEVETATAPQRADDLTGLGAEDMAHHAYYRHTWDGWGVERLAAFHQATIEQVVEAIQDYAETMEMHRAELEQRPNHVGRAADALAEDS